MLRTAKHGLLVARGRLAAQQASPIGGPVGASYPVT